MEIFSRNKIYNFMGKSNLFILVSVVLVALSYFLLFVRGVNYGIDFSGGTLVQIKYEKKAPIDEMRKLLKKEKLFENASITEFGSDDEVVVRFPSSSGSVGEDLSDRVRQILKKTGNFEIRRVDMVGPKVGSELREKGLMAMVVSVLAILLYITIRFEWRFALSSILALVHDVSIALGAIALFRVEVNLDILAALMTILGYSLNDTIIVFDRIREGIQEARKFDLNTIINDSVSKTLSRTTLTSLTTFFVVLTLYLFGGEIIKGFSFTLLVGIIVGTYSSIFVASAMLVRLGFNVEEYKKKEAEKLKRKAEKDKIRAMYEKGVV